MYGLIMLWNLSVWNLCHQNSTWIFVYDFQLSKVSLLKSQETVVRLEAEAGTKTVSNILLFLSLSSLSSPPPPVSTFFSEDIDAHLNSRDRTTCQGCFWTPVEKKWKWWKNGGCKPDAEEGCNPPLHQLVFGIGFFQHTPLNACNWTLPTIMGREGGKIGFKKYAPLPFGLSLTRRRVILPSFLLTWWNIKVDLFGFARN